MPFRYYAADGRGDDDYSGTITLDALRQYALIKYVKTGAGLSTLYDENNYAITYDNPAQGQVTSLQVGISRYSSGDSDMIVDYRTVSPYSTAYTLSLTDDEWQRLYSYYSGSTSMGFYFLIKTVIGSKTYVRPFSTTIYLKNHSPTLNPTVVAVHNSDHYNLTGSDKTLIKYMSDAQYEINAAAVKGAVIKEQFVRNGDTYYEPSGVISAVESNTFYFGATDTRGTVVNSAIIFNNLADLKWVEYVKLTTNIKDIQFNADGSLTVTASGKYFSGNFGQADNKLTIDYEVHQVNDVDGDWQTLGFVTPSVDSNNNYTYSFTITGLDYQKRYAVSIKANDELMTTDVVSKTIASTPVFDWGENDFNFNVPVNMTDGYVYPQKLLWGNPDSLTTYSQLGDNETVTLDEPISSQPTGIVLVFSLYRNNAVEDVSINSFFVSKAEVVHLLGGAPHLFMMGINSNLSVF
ncbi:MAG: hypothetical protein IKB64_03455, partial [Paludibacteraceae bacterium]|nr:hypothetical protein [Paludibacteraceae bacterium]